MLELLKIIHFLALGAGVGLGVANMILGIRASKAEGPAIGTLRQSQGALGRAALVAIILLWITGVWMWAGYHDLTMAPLFLLKIAAVLVLTLLSLTINMQGAKAARSGTPLDPEYAKKMGMGMSLMSLLSICIAVIFFT